MISAAVKQLQSAKKDLAAKIQGLQAEASKIDNAIAALTGTSVSSAVAKPAKKGSYTRTPAQRAALAKALKAHWAKIRAAKAGKTTVAKPAKKQKKMSALGKLRIKLGSLNRYGKKEEAKKVQAQIAALEAKAGQASVVVAKPATSAKKKAMSPLTKLKLRLGGLIRYGKTKEVKEVRAQIAALETKAKK